MSGGSFPTSADTVKKIAASGFTDAIEMLAIIEVLEAGNVGATPALNAAGAGRAAGHIQRALFTRLHFLVARAYSKSRDGDLHARRAFDLLKSHAVAKEMQNPGDLAEARQFWVKCCGDHRLQRFLHFRDKFLAHLGEPEPGQDIPTYGEVFAIARQTATALEKLAHVTGVVGLSLESQIPAHKESAEKFWEPWVKGEKK
ncbi:MAG TPA: hypothetical protein VHD59_06850 [Pseudolabrys sp.]|nr:hypothetical protein [Pseudolabrys sp.]